MKSFLFIIIAIVFWCCTGKEHQRYAVSDKFKQYIPKDTSSEYFSNDLLLNKQTSVDSFIKKWYSETLFSLQEPILYNYSGEGEAIRLLWLRSFDSPLVIRISKFKDTVYANIKELKGKSSDIKPQMLTDTIIALETKRWQEILSGLNENKFWNAKIEDNSSSKDGITWVLESRLRNKYHCINRWDDGRLSSENLILYAKELIKIGQSILPMKGSK